MSDLEASEGPESELTMSRNPNPESEIPGNATDSTKTKEEQENKAASSSSSSSVKPPLTLRQQNAKKLLFQFTKTFVTLMESTIFSRASEAEETEETDEYFDDFEYSQEAVHPLSDSEFAFEQYFPADQKEAFRSLFMRVAFDLFTSYEYQLLVLAREKRKIAEIAEDIVHNILDNFKESQRGCNPHYIKPEITKRFLIELALQHVEPEGIIYNSEWSAVEILENPGILVPLEVVQEHGGSRLKGLFFQSDWQKNFIGVKKKIGSKYGFRLKFGFETEISILRNFEKVPYSSVSPLYLQYEYCLTPEVKGQVKAEVEKELGIEEKMRRFGIKIREPSGSVGEAHFPKDKVKEFQLKLLIQKQEEERNSDKVMKQVVQLGKKVREELGDKVEKILPPGDYEKGKKALLRSHYNVRFEIKEGGDGRGFLF